MILATVYTSLPEVKKALVLAPHPDDEVFGCGGLLMLLKEQGAELTVIIATNGAAGGDVTNSSLTVSRIEESCAAASLMGLGEPLFWGLPDRGLVYGETLIERISKAVLEHDSELVILPSPTELHPDHQALSLAGAEAIRRQGRHLLAAFYEINAPLPNPNLLIDISEVVKTKLAAMACFVSQLKEQPYDRRIEGLNRFRSYFMGAGVNSAEAFLLIDSSELAPGLAELFEGPLAHRRRFGFAVTALDMPLVSVIVRSMDRPLLSRALDSLALQTWPNCEVVVVNAKGGDHHHLQDYCGSFPLRLINQGGAPLPRSQAANAGLAACRGSYLAFLDDDDSMDADHLHFLVKALQENPPGAVAYSGVRGTFAESQQIQLIEFREAGVDFTRLLLGNIIPIHAVLFPADLVAQGVCFDECLDLYEDWDFWLQVARKRPFVFVDRISATYHTGGDSAVGLAAAADADVSRRATGMLMDKWLRLLDPVELSRVADRYHLTRNQLQSDVATLKHQIAEQDVRFAAQMEKRDIIFAAQLADRDERIADLNRQLADLYGSRSWRVSAPLRWAAGQVRQIRGFLFPSTGTGMGLFMLLQRAFGVRPWPDGSPRVSQGFAGEPLQPPIQPELSTLPLVSVIMPVYNACRIDQRFFLRALESIASQIYANIELIVVDDGSTDDTRQVFETFLSEHPRLKASYYHKENGGQSSARNFGASRCNGRYIGFLDQDDEWFEDKLERVIPWMESQPIDMLYTDADVIDGDDQVTYHRIHCNHYMGWPHPKGSIEDILYKDIIVMPGLMTVRKEFFDAVGGFDEQLSGYEDDDLFLRMYEKGRIFYLPETTLRWRIYGDNYSFSHRMLASRIYYWKKIMEHYAVSDRRRGSLISQRFFWEFVSQAILQYTRGNQLYIKSIMGAKEIVPFLPKGQRLFFKLFFMLAPNRLLSILSQ